MKKTKFIVLILMMALIIIFPLTISATYETQIPTDKYSSSGPSASDVKDMYAFGGSIAGVIQIAGTIVSAGALIIIGIRYVIASADEKAEYRERMIPFVIGAILLFGASNLVNIIYKMFSN